MALTIRAIARVYRADGSESMHGYADVLLGEDVLPGFACKLDALFRRSAN